MLISLSLGGFKTLQGMTATFLSKKCLKSIKIIYLLKRILGYPLSFNSFKFELSFKNES
jgi:hypothetical protein